MINIGVEHTEENQPNEAKGDKFSLATSKTVASDYLEEPTKPIKNNFKKKKGTLAAG